MTVLIVDDNAGVRRLLRRAVLDIASMVWECSDGSEALAQYDNRRPDIVLMDVRMPRVDGLAATRQICRLHPTARIVVVTDYDDQDLREAASEAGASAYVLKQNITELAGLIRTLVQQSR